jgi:hypothetical protein
MCSHSAAKMPAQCALVVVVAGDQRVSGWAAFSLSAAMFRCAAATSIPQAVVAIGSRECVLFRLGAGRNLYLYVPYIGRRDAHCPHSWPSSAARNRRWRIEQASTADTAAPHRRPGPGDVRWVTCTWTSLAACAVCAFPGARRQVGVAASGFRRLDPLHDFAIPL